MVERKSRAGSVVGWGRSKIIFRKGVRSGMGILVCMGWMGGEEGPGPGKRYQCACKPEGQHGS